MEILVRDELPGAFLKPDEVAAVLRLSPGTIRRHLNAGDIHGVRIGAGPRATWRIPVSELRRFTEGEQ